ncbi:MAG: hypothetical protein ACXVCP_12560 [Bdellovibrio sp.]
MKYLFLFFLLSPFFVQAAPVPGAGSSVLTNPDKGLYLANKGFTLKTEGTDWIPYGNANSLLGTVRFSAKDKKAKEGSLSVRTEKIPKNSSLDLYTRKWMKEYPNYGFEVLSAKNFTLNGYPALVVDMLSRSKNKQIRQLILKNDDHIAVLTCIDNRAGFAKSLQNCNQIMKSFTWTSSTETLKEKSKKTTE